MPRKNPEQRSGSIYRAGIRPARPPKTLTPAARRIWRDITGARPPDWFDAGQLGLLALHVEMRARATEVAAELARVAVDSPEFGRLARNLKVLDDALATGARQLRLTVVATIDRKSGQLDERGIGRGNDLIGGDAGRSGRHWRAR